MSDLAKILEILGVAVYYSCWTAAYIIVVVKGFKDKAVGFPLVAILADVAWEFLYTFIYPYKQGIWVNLLNASWLIPDVRILVLALLYGRKYFIKNDLGRWYFPIIIFSLASFFVLFIFFRKQYHDDTGTEVAFLLNAVVSVAYLFMLAGRKVKEGVYDLAGISIWVTALKFVGTAVTSLVVTFYYPVYNPHPSIGLIQAGGIFVFIVDAFTLYFHLTLLRQKQAR